MNIGLVVEGPSDHAAYPVLLHRIREDAFVHQVRECGGKSRLKGIFPAFLKEFDRNSAWQITIAFVIQDSDCNPSQEITNKLQASLRVSGFRPKLRVEFLAPKCDLETWLSVDENAINQVAERRGKPHRVGPLQIRFEFDKEAKGHFLAQLTRADLRSLPDVYGEIASFVDLERTAAACPSFREFMARVRAF